MKKKKNSISVFLKSFWNQIVSYQFYIYKIFIVIFVICSLYLLIPNQNYDTKMIYKIDDIAQDDHIAQLDFPVYKDSNQLISEQKQAKKNIYPIYTYYSSIFEKVRLELGKILQNLGSDKADSINADIELGADSILLYELKESELNDKLLVEMSTTLETCYSRGVCRDLMFLKENAINDIISIVDIGAEKTIERQADIKTLFDEKTIIDTIFSSLSWFIEDNVVRQNFIYNLTMYVFEPNLIYDAKTTELLREKAKNSVSITKGYVKKGEKIVGKHERITPEILRKLNSQDISLQANNLDMKKRLGNFFLPGLARFLMILLAVLGFIFIIYFYDPLFFDQFKNIFMLFFLAMIPLAGYSVVYSNYIKLIYLVPLPTFIILASILFSYNIGLFLAFFVSFIVAIYSNMDFKILFLMCSVLLLANYSVVSVRHRRDYFRSMIIIPLGFVIVILINYIYTVSYSEDLILSVSFGVINGLISPSFAIGFLPVFEYVFHRTTDLTLLEISDLNHPLLKRLAMEIPGTYNHSLQVGVLAESAATAIGANSIKARVGAYFHDIGKLAKPNYFIENQRNENKHEQLSPNMSALIVLNHVKEGIELAKKYRLPSEIFEIIQQHHGTTLVRYFYKKAQENNPHEEISEEIFRYPGPKPRSKEAGIVMLADSIEAMSRSLDNPKVSRLKQIINDTIKDKFISGELDESNLTLRELNSIAEKFLIILAGSFHVRIKYPGQEENNGRNK